MTLLRIRRGWRRCCPKTATFWVAALRRPTSSVKVVLQTGGFGVVRRDAPGRQRADHGGCGIERAGKHGLPHRPGLPAGDREELHHRPQCDAAWCRIGDGPPCRDGTTSLITLSMREGLTDREPSRQPRRQLSPPWIIGMQAKELEALNQELIGAGFFSAGRALTAGRRAGVPDGPPQRSGGVTTTGRGGPAGAPDTARLADPAFGGLHVGSALDLRQAATRDEAAGYTYAPRRTSEPTRALARIAAMEGAGRGFVTGSGMAAFGAVLLGLLKAVRPCRRRRPVSTGADADG